MLLKKKKKKRKEKKKKVSYLRKRRNGKAWITEGMATSYNGPYGEAPPKSSAFLRFQVYKRVGKDFTSWSIWKGIEICFCGL